MTKDFGKIYDHNLYFYSDILKKQEVLFSNLKNGLDNRCSILYIASGESVNKAKTLLSYFGFRFDKPNKPKIVMSKEWYITNGEFNPNRVLEQFRSLLDDSLDRGFEGLYVSNDLADTFDCLRYDLKSWLKYEASFGRTFDFPIEVICAYQTDQVKYRDEELIQLVQAHKKTITAETLSILDNQKLCPEAIAKTELMKEQTLKNLHKKLELDTP
ncbi:MAG: hypothetical protein QG670_2443 [Thermoproteota archaeon]|nr:hypothetical protein [Thermoproteota archaeon]